MYFTSKVWTVIDLIKEIGFFKKMFEQASDIEKLNQSRTFQELVYHVFGRVYDSGLIVRNMYNNDRLHISICKHKKPIVIVTFEILHKRKRIPYYFDILFLDMNSSALSNQRILTKYILNDCLLLWFFRYETSCK